MNNKNLQKTRDYSFLSKKKLNEINNNENNNENNYINNNKHNYINNNEDNYINYFYIFITVTGVLLFFTLAKTFYTCCGILYFIRCLFTNNYKIIDKDNNITLIDNLLIKSLKVNYIFWIIFLTCIVYLSINYGDENSEDVIKIISGLLTVIACIIVGWMVHKMAHTIDYTNTVTIIYNKYLSFLPKWCKKILDVLCFYADFHTKVHHNPKVNKIWYNLLIEFIQNIIIITIGPLYISSIIKLKIVIFSSYFIPNNIIIIFWGLIYATAHIINYNIIESKEHISHHNRDLSKNGAYNNHNNKIYNYGIDILDILFDTKYENDNSVENINHYAYNCIILLIIIILIDKFNIIDYNIVNYIKKLLLD